MRPMWTAEAVGLMHLHGIKQIEVAERCGMRQPYLSLVLNGVETPPGGRDRVMTAIHQLIIAKLSKEESQKTDYERRSVKNE